MNTAVSSRPPSAGSTGVARRAAAARDAFGAQNISLLIALALLVAVIGSQNQDFFRTSNLINIGVAISVLGVVSIVMTVVIVSGGLDISVGSTAGLASVAAAGALTAVDSAAFGIAAGVAIGAVAGAVNGLIITFGRVNPVIATLATYSAYRGVAFALTDGKAVAVDNDTFIALGSDRIWGIPYPVIVLVLVAIGFFVFLRYTDIGRNVYAIGGNAVASRLAGISLTKYRLGIYTLSGAVAGLAGVLLTAKTLAGEPSAGTQGLELEAITAALLGGCALAGGKGTIVGALLGVTIIGVLDNGLILLNVPSFYQLIAKGALLVLAVMIQEWRTGRVRGALA
ncbi:MAG TPA: ABC transporter permease [Conexibacter sp.]|nr:ABC transporter permease [Conexibacter sp.]